MLHWLIQTITATTYTHNKGSYILHCVTEQKHVVRTQPCSLPQLAYNCPYLWLKSMSSSSRVPMEGRAPGTTLQILNLLLEQTKECTMGLGWQTGKIARERERQSQFAIGYNMQWEKFDFSLGLALYCSRKETTVSRKPFQRPVDLVRITLL